VNGSTFAELYEQHLVGPLFRPWAEVILDRVGPVAGHRVLDVACGTGIVARLATMRQAGHGHVVGIDNSPQMLAVARAVEPRVDWREANANDLPLAAGEQFDVVICQQGLQFFPDKPAALREMRRSAAPGARLAVAVWKSLEETPFFRGLHAVAQRHLGTFLDRRHAFGDQGALERTVADAGFEDVRVDTPTLRIRFSDPAAFVRLNAQAVVGMSAGASTMSDDERARLVAVIEGESGDVVQQHMGTGGLSFELGANLATARATATSFKSRA
jgi:ubiquinone/menaquinone biosynthesis C-methylase UbiE